MSAKGSPKLVLHYFDIKGRAEPIRLILAAGGIAYTDNRYTKEQWPAAKPTMPFGTLPVLEVDGAKFAETTAIARFVGKLAGLSGKTPIESFDIDSKSTTLIQIAENAILVLHEKDEAVKKVKLEKFKADTAATLTKLNDGVKSDYLTGKSVSYADVQLLAVEQFLTESLYKDGAFKDFAKLKAITGSVAKLPGVAAYLKKRDATK